MIMSDMNGLKESKFEKKIITKKWQIKMTTPNQISVTVSQDRIHAKLFESHNEHQTVG